MITVTISRDELYENVYASDDVKIVQWDCLSKPPVPYEDIDMVVVPFAVKPKHVENINKCPNLKLVQTASVGYDALKGTLNKGVRVANMQGFNADATSELAVTLLLAYLRDVPEFVRNQERSKWVYKQSDTLAEKKVLLLGAGDIGSEVARKLEAFDAHVTKMARTARGDILAIEDLAQQVPLHDILFIMLPLTDETRSLIDASILAKIPDGGIIVNAGRGPIVKTDDLIAELETGRISAVFDVVDPEPLPQDSPLWKMKNVLFTPHVAGDTKLTQKRAVAILDRQIDALSKGNKIINIVL
ncbi:MAG: NAD(P)-dependent oxidoreductase [Micrococcaceae bacterium]